MTVELNDATLDVEDPKRIVAQATTDQEGFYSFAEVKPGDYSLGASASYKDQDELPCFDPFGITTTKDGWLAIIGTQESTNLWVIVVTGADDRFSIAAGDMLQKDIDLACK